METLLIYIAICAISAGIAAKQGWSVWDSFFLAFMLTPLIIARRLVVKADYIFLNNESTNSLLLNTCKSSTFSPTPI